MLKAVPDPAAKSGPSDAIVMNAWYVAAWSSELGADVLGRRIAGRAMVLRRTGQGLEIAEDRPPQAGAAKTYPTVERDGIVWVFPGDPARAEAMAIPEHPWVTQWWSAVGYERIAARTSLLIDNLLDLSHETYLHARGIGTAEVAETPIEVERHGCVLHVNRRMYGVACPPSFQASSGLQSPIDRAQEIEFFPPGFYVLHARIAAAGDTGHGLLNKVVYGITPETARTSHLFYGIARELDGRGEVPEAARKSTQSRTVGEDKRALELLETVIAAEPDGPPEVSIGIDRGGLLGRRMIAELVARETVTP
jgi:vanillate O-demethylase monooxygenase subunit